MARSTNRLNARIVSSSKAGLHADGNGLYLSVSASGAKSWRVIYQLQGQRRELGIGSARVVSLAQARAKAQEARLILQEGRDPKTVWRSSTSKLRTFGQFALDYLQDQEAAWKSAKHRLQWRNTLETYAAPIWDKAIKDISVDDVLAILRPIWSAKPETASRVRSRLERVLGAAKVRGLRAGDNPAAWRENLEHLLAKRRKGQTKHHPAMPFKNVPAFYGDLNARTGLAARALQLTILTSARNPASSARASPTGRCADKRTRSCRWGNGR